MPDAADSHPFEPREELNCYYATVPLECLTSGPSYNTNNSAILARHSGEAHHTGAACERRSEASRMNAENPSAVGKAEEEATQDLLLQTMTVKMSSFGARGSHDLRFRAPCTTSSVPVREGCALTRSDPRTLKGAESRRGPRPRCFRSESPERCLSVSSMRTERGWSLHPGLGMGRRT